MPYVPRALATTLRRAMRTFPAVLITGPRQTGKTTLLREELGDSVAVGNRVAPVPPLRSVRAR